MDRDLNQREAVKLQNQVKDLEQDLKEKIADIERLSRQEGDADAQAKQNSFGAAADVSWAATNQSLHEHQHKQN